MSGDIFAIGHYTRQKRRVRDGPSERDDSVDGQCFVSHNQRGCTYASTEDTFLFFIFFESSLDRFVGSYGDDLHFGIGKHELLVIGAGAERLAPYVCTRFSGKAETE